MIRLWCKLTLHRPARWPEWGACLCGDRYWQHPAGAHIDGRVSPDSDQTEIGTWHEQFDGCPPQENG